MRAIAGRPLHAYFRVESDDGVLTTADDASTVAVEITDAAGETVTVGAAAETETPGVYGFSTATSLALGAYTATATATLSGLDYTYAVGVRVVGGRYVSLSRLRALADLADLPASAFLERVDAVEDLVESLLEFSAVPAASTVTWRTEYTLQRMRIPGVWFPRRFVSLTASGGDVDFATAVPDGHSLALPEGSVFPAGSYTGVIEHGRWDTPPGDLQDAIIRLAQDRATALGSIYPARATRIMTEASEMWFGAIDGEKRLTGISDVDAVLRTYRLDMPV